RYGINRGDCGKAWHGPPRRQVGGSNPLAPTWPADPTFRADLRHPGRPFVILRIASHLAFGVSDPTTVGTIGSSDAQRIYNWLGKDSLPNDKPGTTRGTHRQTREVRIMKDDGQEHD